MAPDNSQSCPGFQINRLVLRPGNRGREESLSSRSAARELSWGLIAASIPGFPATIKAQRTLLYVNISPQIPVSSLPILDGDARRPEGFPP
jgi:hypothetical protein